MVAIFIQGHREKSSEEHVPELMDSHQLKWLILSEQVHWDGDWWVGTREGRWFFHHWLTLVFLAHLSLLVWPLNPYTFVCLPLPQRTQSSIHNSNICTLFHTSQIEVWKWDLALRIPAASWCRSIRSCASKHRSILFLQSAASQIHLQTHSRWQGLTLGSPLLPASFSCRKSSLLSLKYLLSSLILLNHSNNTYITYFCLFLIPSQTNRNFGSPSISYHPHTK